MSEAQTTAAVLRSWADGADESMAQPLRELADHCEAEIAAAKVATEASVLAVVAEAFETPVTPETFAVAASVRLLRNDLDESIRAGKTHIERATNLRQHLDGIAKILDLLPEDHAVIDYGAVTRAVLALLSDRDRLQRVRTALATP